MLRRISSARRRAAQRSALSDAVAPLSASLLVPLLVVFALEVPAHAIDRIASPFLGHSRKARLPLRPAVAHLAAARGDGWSMVAGAPDPGLPAALRRYGTAPSLFEEATTGPGEAYVPSGTRVRRELALDDLEEAVAAMPPAVVEPGTAPVTPGPDGGQLPRPTSGDVPAASTDAPAPALVGRDGSDAPNALPEQIGSPAPTVGGGEFAPPSPGGSSSGPQFGDEDESESSAAGTDGSENEPAGPGSSEHAPGHDPNGPGNSENAPGQEPRAGGLPSDDPGLSEQSPGHDPNGPGNSENAPGHDPNGPGNSENAPGHDPNGPGNSENAPGQAHDTPGNSGNAFGHDPNGPGNSENAPGHTGQARGNARNDNGRVSE